MKKPILAVWVFILSTPIALANCEFRENLEYSLVDTKCTTCGKVEDGDALHQMRASALSELSPSSLDLRTNASLFLIGQHLHYYVDRLAESLIFAEEPAIEGLIHQADEVLKRCVFTRRADSHTSDVVLYKKMASRLHEQKLAFSESVRELARRASELRANQKKIIVGYVEAARRLKTLNRRLKQCDPRLFREYSKKINETNLFLLSSHLFLGGSSAARSEACGEFSADFTEALNIVQRFPRLLSSVQDHDRQPFMIIARARGSRAESMALRFLTSDATIEFSLGALGRELSAVCTHPFEASTAVLRDRRFLQALIRQADDAHVAQYCSLSCDVRQHRVSISAYVRALGPGNHFDCSFLSCGGSGEKIGLSEAEKSVELRKALHSHLEDRLGCLADLTQKFAQRNLDDAFAELNGSDQVKNWLQKGPAQKKIYALALEKLRALNETEQKQVLKNLLQIPPADFPRIMASIPSQLDLSEIAILAYQANIARVFGGIAKMRRVPIVLRESTPAAQAGQQNDLSTKGMDLKNKSTVFSDVMGSVPCDPEVGKIGDQLRDVCKRDGEVCKKRMDYLRMKLEEEKRMISEHLAKKNVEGNPLYFCVPVTRVFRGHKEMVAYERVDGQISGTTWVPYVDPPTGAALVLGDHDGVKITADTDLFLVGQPKGKRGIVKYDEKGGYRTAFTDRVGDESNRLWKDVTGNTNEIIRHGDEMNFGLNALNDPLLAFSHTGEMTRFDLRVGNPDRSSELMRFALWLKEESRFSEIIVPTPEVQQKRFEALQAHGVSLDYSEARADYDVIREVLRTSTPAG